MSNLRLCLALSLLVIIGCNGSPVTSEAASNIEENGAYDESTEDPNIDGETQMSKSSENLPILPPIILLDFADDNATSSDEKSKRTVENNLGYGYLRNNLLNGKYNYYFPGGKSGTTVSIEESISPFEPKTIIEPFKPITENPSYSNLETTHQPIVKQTSDTLTRNQQVHRFPPNYPLNHQVLGQRTKLQKYLPPNNYSPPSLSPPPNTGIAYTTIRPEYNHLPSAYSTPKPQQEQYSGLSYSGSREIYDSYTPAPPSSYDEEHELPFSHPRQSYDPSTTARPLPVDPAAFNLPKYTFKNGIRYENKIIWKYRDGTIATPPSSYMTSYSEYSNQPQANSNYQTVGASRNPPITHQSPEDVSITYDSLRQDVRYTHNAPSPLYMNPNYQNQEHQPASPMGNIHNQRPAQFPNDQERYHQQQSSNTLNNYNGGLSQTQSYDLSYQQKYGFRPQQQGSRYEPMRQVSKYAVDSPNAEYSTTPANPTNSITTSGQLTPNLLAKYTPQAQMYLTKVFAQSQQAKMKEQYNTQGAQYPSTNYEKLLQYNPSISQYVRDPSTILNAQPTFIQAGNSLIPVIILRVDGARPAQPQHAPSINLKALLQQYLSQYAEDSKTAHSRPASHKYKEPSSLNDLTQLANALSRLSQKHETGDQSQYPVQKLANHPLNYDSTRYHDKTSYDEVQDHVAKVESKYGSRIGSNQKVKSVQIIEDS